nr:MAG TPA_asm: hypothetical protein [Caudoviricetes sp.]
MNQIYLIHLTYHSYHLVTLQALYPVTLYISI